MELMHSYPLIKVLIFDHIIALMFALALFSWFYDEHCFVVNFVCVLILEEAKHILY